MTKRIARGLAAMTAAILLAVPAVSKAMPSPISALCAKGATYVLDGVWSGDLELIDYGNWLMWVYCDNGGMVASRGVERGARGVGADAFIDERLVGTPTRIA